MNVAEPFERINAADSLRNMETFELIKKKFANAYWGLDKTRSLSSILDLDLT